MGWVGGHRGIRARTGQRGKREHAKRRYHTGVTEVEPGFRASPRPRCKFPPNQSPELVATWIAVARGGEGEANSGSSQTLPCLKGSCQSKSLRPTGNLPPDTDTISPQT